MERGGAAPWQLPPSRLLIRTGGDNMAAAGRNLLLELSIKATEGRQELCCQTFNVQTCSHCHKSVTRTVCLQTLSSKSARIKTVPNEAEIKEGSGAQTLPVWGVNGILFNKVIIWVLLHTQVGPPLLNKCSLARYKGSCGGWRSLSGESTPSNRLFVFRF